MKTGIVMEIKNGKAAVLKTGGRFVTVKAQSHWNVGDVVMVAAEKNIRHIRSLCTVAACFLFFCSVSLFGYRTYYSEAAIVSLDVNPSIELKSNRFDRIISAEAFNEEGELILQQINLKNKKVDNALLELFAGQLSDYVLLNNYIILTVQSDNKKRESMLLKQLQDLAGQLPLDENQSAEVEVYAVDRNTVSDAHSHHVTAGKYMALLQLREMRPQINIEEYADCGLEEIKEQIKDCEANNGDSSHDHGESHR